MALIALEGMRFQARHGFYEEEQIIGNTFIVDVYVNARTNRAETKDDLFLTVNYETIFLICQAEMRKPAKLLENVANRILYRLMGQFDNVNGVRVRVKKMHPPLGGHVDCAYVELEQGKW